MTKKCLSCFSPCDAVSSYFHARFDQNTQFTQLCEKIQTKFYTLVNSLKIEIEKELDYVRGTFEYECNCSHIYVKLVEFYIIMIIIQIPYSTF